MSYLRGTHSENCLKAGKKAEGRDAKLQYLSAQEGVLEPISVYRTYERTNALTRLLRYKVRLRTVSLRAEPSDVRTRVQLVLEEPVPNHSFRAPPFGQTILDALAPRSSYEDTPVGHNYH